MDSEQCLVDLQELHRPWKGYSLVGKCQNAGTAREELLYQQEKCIAPPQGSDLVQKYQLQSSLR